MPENHLKFWIQEATRLNEFEKIIVALCVERDGKDVKKLAQLVGT